MTTPIISKFIKLLSLIAISKRLRKRFQTRRKKTKLGLMQSEHSFTR